jgi:hypothetical protein
MVFLTKPIDLCMFFRGVFFVLDKEKEEVTDRAVERKSTLFAPFMVIINISNNLV